MTESVAEASTDSIGPIRSNTYPGLRLSTLAFVWLALLILIKVVIVPMAFSNFGPWITGVEARHCAWLANLVGAEAAVEGDVAATPYFAIRVTQSCTGIDYLLYMIGLVALFPMRNSRRPIWLVLLPATLYFLLICRLTFLLMIGRWWPTWVTFIHDSWNVGFILLFVGVWVAFVHRQLKVPAV
ncbi:MAG: archaeosortase/exosortase family protein [Candidatus Omnitrophica bacterium]|nr:archaeosortase/exosortase family protein [Candidatus Omnitrophota bacterium]